MSHTIEEPQLADASATASESVATSPAPRKPAPITDLYQIVWRWHFYAGLVTIPVMWILAITGAIYTFRTELTEWRDAALLNVTPQPSRMSYDELRRLAAAEMGDNHMEAVIVYPGADRSVQFVAHVEDVATPDEDEHAEERHQLVYIDPYTGTVLGTRIKEEDFFDVVLWLHRSLLLGTFGRCVTELTTSWGVILMATGVFLWWPRGKKNVGVWVPRLRGKLYAVLRDWHAAGGIYTAPLVAIVVVTGLFFTPLLGLTFNTTVQKIGHWPVQEWFAPPKSEPVAEGTSPASLDAVIPAFLSQARPDDVVRFRLPESPEQAYRAFLMRDEDKNSYRAVDVDQYSAKILSVVGSTDLKLGYRIRLWAVSLHMGQIFGTPTKVLALFASLVVFLLSFTGVWMWWKRRPEGRTGFPRRPLAGSLPGWGWAVVVLAGILLPTAGLSMLVIMAVDRWLLSRRVPVAAAEGAIVDRGPPGS
ncbi:MAG: PepSY-associated TM helix domain-containing protein [Planctomycetaceae bacterium]